LTKSEVLARLNERRASIMSAQWGRDKANRDAIQRTLDALDSPQSYYVILTKEEREIVRSEWTELAARLGLKLVQRRAARVAPALPPNVLDFFGHPACIPQRPKASDDPERFGTQAMSWDKAQNLRSVELNPPSQIYWLTFDCDHPNYDLWKTAGLLEPAFITVNPVKGTHHVAYLLTEPVCRSERARARPLAFLHAVREGLRHALDGDTSYVGLLTKNPLHPGWTTIRPTVMPSYSLAELAATVDLRRSALSTRPRFWPQPEVNLRDVKVGGRNRALFDHVRIWARKNSDDLEGILEFAERSNAQLEQPLGFNEVKSIVRSVERYMLNPRKGGSRGGADAAFSKAQAARGKLGGRPPTTQITQPWVEAGISRSTWYSQQADRLPVPPNGRGRPVTTKDSKPWLTEGISRATWYRLQKKGAA